MFWMILLLSGTVALVGAGPGQDAACSLLRPGCKDAGAGGAGLGLRGAWWALSWAPSGDRGHSPVMCLFPFKRNKTNKLPRKWDAEGQVNEARLHL